MFVYKAVFIHTNVLDSIFSISEHYFIKMKNSPILEEMLKLYMRNRDNL